MPSEKLPSKAPTRKVGQGKTDSSKSGNNDSVIGKKRKKKKETDSESKGSSQNNSKKLIKDQTRGKQEVSSIPAKKTGQAKDNSAVSHHGVHKTRQDEHFACSSSSSVEISKPENKIQRCEYSSSDAMSTGEHTCTSAMEMSSCTNTSSIPSSYTNSPYRSKTSFSPARSAGSLTSAPQPSSSRLSHATEAQASEQNSSKTSLNSSLCGQYVKVQESPDKAEMESLRWEQECSDEEREKERIELYKENRRKRYQNALEERKAKMLTATARTRPFYVCPSSSV